MATKAQREKADGLNHLKTMLPDVAGPIELYTLTTIPPSYGRSGHRRYVRVFVVVNDGIREVTGAVSRTLGVAYARDGIGVNGGGFNAGHEVAERVARVLNPDAKMRDVVLHREL